MEPTYAKLICFVTDSRKLLWCLEAVMGWMLVDKTEVILAIGKAHLEIHLVWADDALTLKYQVHNVAMCLDPAQFLERQVVTVGRTVCIQLQLVCPL